MKRLAALSACLALSACATTSQTPEATLTTARATYIATCGEVVRLWGLGKKLPTARDACISADNVLDSADFALAAGRASEAASGVTRALILIAAAQAALSTSGAVK